METAAIQPKRWTRAQYDQMIDMGVFLPDDHVELINGEILAMTPQKSRHAVTVDAVRAALQQAFDPDRTYIREEKPFAIEPDSEPEPDIAVVAGSRRDYADQHPSAALLIVEVADSSLSFDRKTKGPLYARAGVTDYWIVNLVDGIVEVYREPVQTANGWDYRLVRRCGREERVSPLAQPTAAITVADLLPPV